MYPGESVTFTCVVHESSGWEYTWFHNNKQIEKSKSFTIKSIDHSKSGNYHCRVKRGEFDSESSAPQTLQVSDPPTPTLKLESPWPDVFLEEVVAFSCDVGNPDWVFTWYRNNKKVEADDVLTLDDEGTLLNITVVSKEHEGEYACKAHLDQRAVSSGFSKTANIKVYDNIPKPTLRKTPGFDPMYVGETVNFTCKVDVSTDWEYHWYKDTYDQPRSDQPTSFPVGLSDKGKYMCQATRGKTTSTDFSDEIHLNVQEIPTPSLTSNKQWLDLFPEESVKLMCSMNSGSHWTYTWSRDGREVRASGAGSSDLSGATLSIDSASAGDKGQYQCKGHLKERSVSSSSSSGLNLMIHDEKPIVTLTRDPDYTVMYPGESVNFMCNINVSYGWEYLWFKDKTPLPENGTQYLVTLNSIADTGSYTCKAKRGAAQVFSTANSRALHLKVGASKPKPSMTQNPNVKKVYVGETVTFTCDVEAPSEWKYRWFKNDTQLLLDRSMHTFNATLSDTGTYKCEAIRDKTRYSSEYSDKMSLLVSEIPAPSTKLKTQWLDVFPSESVKLSCEMDGRTEVSSDWSYTWYKDDQKVQNDDNITFKQDGGTLSIKSASTSHRGRYSCSAKLKSRSVYSSKSSGLTLDVYDTKPLVTLIQKPKFSDMHTGDSVSFSCHINVSTGWEYQWVRNNGGLPESGKNHTITSVSTSDSGSYKCRVKRGKGAVFESEYSAVREIQVDQRPKATIILSTGWSEAFSSDSLVLRCGVESKYQWNYTWYKEGNPIQNHTSEKYKVTPQNDPKQSQYTCEGIRNSRPTYSERSDQFKTSNLLLKRRVLLSISGVILFGIIAVPLACIICRIFRKPADEEDRTEEVDLFLTMAQQKGADIPCPLVEYITDASLNAPPKEKEENGIICSETTPLPITSQEDQDVTDESPDAAENNGGLVSFKQ
ncbi:titin [Xyrichtys novacula]|nr:titin [Xyrichtys novacula]